ncbi:uncharacterized protein [Antedon mediterranea]|uniref:uncharacterized protein n=1 Tax=Antedon mediterranea TaxID=105859 RepID=UPI003AF7F5B3
MRILFPVVLLGCLVRKSSECNRATTSDTGSRDSLDTVTLLNSNCGQTIETYGFVMSSHSTQGRYDYFNQTTDCSYTVTAMGDFTKVMVDFRWFDIGERYGDNTNCSHASLRLYDGSSSTSAVLLQNPCGTVRPSVVESTGTSMTIRVTSNGDWSVIDFRAVFTAFNSESDCQSSDFQCSTTKRCISSEVVCDRQNISNCGAEDYSDQSDGSPSFCPINEPADLMPLWISLAVIGVLSPFVLYWCCWRPGYFAWICGCCRRRRFSKKPCSCCTKHSKYFCKFICSGALCAGCDCSDDPKQENREDSQTRQSQNTVRTTEREATALRNVFIVVRSENNSPRDRPNKPNGSTKGVFLDDTGSPIVFSNINEARSENDSLSIEKEPDSGNKRDNSAQTKGQNNNEPNGRREPRPGLGRRGKVLYEPESGTNSPRSHRRPPYRISPMPPPPDEYSDTNSPDGSFPSSQSLPSALMLTSTDSTPVTARRNLPPPRKGVFLSSEPYLGADDDIDNGAGAHVREGR